MTKFAIVVVVDDGAWQKLGKPFLTRIEEAAKFALEQFPIESMHSFPPPRSGGGGPRSGGGGEAVSKNSSSSLPHPLRRATRATSPATAGEEKNASPLMTILLTSNARVRLLNARFRGQDKPTNVLAFPAGEPGYLGDIAIAHGVAAKEAKAARKRLIDHAAHLVVHGALHLLGYDHVRVREAKVMEALETSLLANLGIADPYAKAKR